MTDSIERRVGAAVGSVAARWSVWTAVGGFTLYVLGYLALRFRVTALGLGTDLRLVDERYLFEGARFLVYLVATVPVALVLALPLLVAAWLVVRTGAAGARGWWTRRTGPLVLGVVVALAMIQLVMRQCFLFDDLLLRSALPGPAWFAGLLTGRSEFPVQVFITLLLVGIVVPVILLRAVGAWSSASARHRGLASALLFLVAVQLLLLPVNYGILNAARPMPRVTPATLEAAGVTGSPGWLVWEGGTGMTFLVGPAGPDRRLVTVPRTAVPRVEIIGSTPFGDLRVAAAGAGPMPRSTQTPERADQRAPAASTPSLAAMLARIAGLTATPRTQRADPLEDAAVGDLYLVDVAGRRPPRPLRRGRFRSPVFVPGENALFALEDDELVRIDLAQEEPDRLGALPGVRKLLGVDDTPAATILFLAEADGRAVVESVEIGSMRRRTVAATLETPRRRWLEGEDRVYDDVRLYVEMQSELPRLAWTDVFVQTGEDRRRNLTQREQGRASRQPALSSDGQLVAFVLVAGDA